MTVQLDPFRAHREAAAVALEDVRRADEAGHELGRRARVDVEWRADLLDAALVEDRDVVAHRQRFLLVVRDVDERHAEVALQRLQEHLHLLPQFQVKSTERLVEQEHLRLVDDRACERDTLALAARELHRLAVAVAVEAHHLQHLGDLGGALAARHAFDLQPVADVLGDRHVREERVVLEDGVDVARVGRLLRDVGAAEGDAARVGLLEAGDHTQRRRLSGARRAEEREEFAVGDVQIDVGDSDHVAVRLSDPLTQNLSRQADPRGCRGRARAPRRRPRTGPGCGSRCRRCRTRGASALARAPAW